MESKTTPGLFFIGEVVDVTGQLGGFNFQWLGRRDSVPDRSCEGECDKRPRPYECLTQLFLDFSAFLHERHPRKNLGRLFQLLQIFAREVTAGKRCI